MKFNPIVKKMFGFVIEKKKKSAFDNICFVFYVEACTICS